MKKIATRTNAMEAAVAVPSKNPRIVALVHAKAERRANPPAKP